MIRSIEREWSFHANESNEKSLTLNLRRDERRGAAPRAGEFPSPPACRTRNGTCFFTIFSIKNWKNTMAHRAQKIKYLIFVLFFGSVQRPHGMVGGSFFAFLHKKQHWRIGLKIEALPNPLPGLFHRHVYCSSTWPVTRQWLQCCPLRVQWVCHDV